MLGAGVGKFDLSPEEKEQLENNWRLVSGDKKPLYLEYLKILYRYQPAVFIMENVKGLSSAKVGKDAERGAYSTTLQWLRRGIGEETVISKSGSRTKRLQTIFNELRAN